MKNFLFPAILAFLFLFSACEHKNKVIGTGDTLTDTTENQEVNGDTLDEFEYEADSVETDDDDDV